MIFYSLIINYVLFYSRITILTIITILFHYKIANVVKLEEESCNRVMTFEQFKVGRNNSSWLLMS